MAAFDHALLTMTMRPWKPACWRASRAWIAAGMLYTLLVNVGVRRDLWGPDSSRWNWVQDPSTADNLVGWDIPGIPTVHRNEVLFELTYFIAIVAIFAWALRANVMTTLVAGASYVLIIQGNFDIRDGSMDAIANYFLATLFAIGVARNARGPLRIMTHNAATVWISLQVCIIYFSSGLYKVAGEPWRQGVALEGILLAPSGSYSPLAIAVSSTLLGVVLTLATVVFEALAPAAVFARSAVLRRTIVFSLIGMHIGIIFVMGLIGFGLVMIGMATMMLRDSDIIWLRSGASRLSQLVVDRFARAKVDSTA